MKRVTLTELKELAEGQRELVWSEAESIGREPKIYLHWTAGDYHTQSPSYHINIDGDGNIFVSADLYEKLSHTWCRNTGSIGVALDCCAGGGSTWLGNYPPTNTQINVMAQVIAVLSDALWITIDKFHVLTHGEAANNEDGDDGFHYPYAWWNDSYGDGNTRGDLEYLGTDESPVYNPYATDGSRGGDVLRGKAIYYQEKGV